ncbi:MAG: FmdB family zinc ribbon protein [Aquiluna sp.]|nr:MAG: FmdB family transcriptional regulator [Candidatus Aquiluna sp. XM-24bin5]
MPTYAYSCKSCNHSFEMQLSFSDKDPASCPECGGDIKKLFGNLGVSFKGSGFYRTDSASSSSTKSESAPSSD